MEPWRNLQVWQKSHQVVLRVYRLTDKFPSDERYCLTSQMRRAAVSVVANIVEGSKRKSKLDQRHFYIMSDASLEELKYYFILSYDLSYISLDEGKNIMNESREIGKMLNGIIASRI